MVNNCKVKINKISSLEKKEKLNNKIKNISDYVKLRDDILNSYTNGYMDSSINQVYIDKLKKRYQKLENKYQILIKNSIDDMQNQYDFITNTIIEVNNCFINEDKTEVKKDLNRKQYEEILAKVNSLKQEDIKNVQLQYLKVVEETITQREIEYKKRVEEERQREIAIQNAWIKLNVPYISQNLSGVYNGCEVAALLMCLKYKGYLTNMDIVTYANDVPKSTDPYQGFIYDIFSLEPRDVVHWIAPNALANYGVSSSGNNNVINTTGYSIDQLDNELNNNNPIVIYLTANLKDPKNWQGEVPGNLHVLVLSGYNKITGDHIIIDPWTMNNGNYTWNISKSQLEKIYNSVGKKSVVIR